jgi:hypothetical protein
VRSNIEVLELKCGCPPHPTEHSRGRRRDDSPSRRGVDRVPGIGQGQRSQDHPQQARVPVRRSAGCHVGAAGPVDLLQPVRGHAATVSGRAGDRHLRQ